MTSKNVEYLTKDKFRELEAELKEATSIRRREIAESLEFAKSLGDLSENAEYQQAREAQAELEDRITTLEDIMKRVVIVSEGGSAKDSSIVSMGSTVSIKKEGDTETRKCKIVGSEEADVISGKISNECPLGMSVIGKKVGEKFSVATPKGKINYTIVSID